MIIHVVRNTEYGEDLKAFTSYQAAVQFALEDAKGYENSLDKEERKAWRQSIAENENDFYRINTLTLETGA